MTLHERIGSVLFKMKIWNIVRYMIDSNVNEQFIEAFVNYIDYLLEQGVHFEIILMEKLPPFPPYRSFRFETKDDCDKFCGVVKSWYGLDYKSKLTKRNRWRLVQC